MNNPNQSPIFSIYYRPQIVMFETAAVSFRVIFSLLNLFLKVFVSLLYGLEYLGQMNAATSVLAQLEPISACPSAVFAFSINLESYINLPASESSVIIFNVKCLRNSNSN